MEEIDHRLIKASVGSQLLFPERVRQEARIKDEVGVLGNTVFKAKGLKDHHQTTLRTPHNDLGHLI